MVGTKLAARYELLEKIGEGGMARVYRGLDHLLNRTVSVKILKDQMTDDPDFVKRFRREAQAVARLSHPNIVNVYDVGEEGDIYYIVMEYVDGFSLKKYIREKGKLPPEEAVAIARQIAEALVQAHGAGIIHRDIKPQNILYAHGGHVKVTDFGIALAADGSTVTCTENILGSVHYFSPEQARGSSLVGEQSDLYSLGIVLYEMVTGKVPFNGDSPIAVALQHVNDEIPPPHIYWPEIPETLERIILKLVQKDPSRRYLSAREFLEDLILFQQYGLSRAVLDEPPLDGETIVMKPVARRSRQEDEQAAATRQATLKKTLLTRIAVIVFLSACLLAGLFLLRSLILVPEVSVPDVRNKPLEEAIEMLTESKLRYTVSNSKFDDTIPAGYVISMEPRQGRTVRQGREISLVISKGPEFTKMPDLYGKFEAEALIMLQNLGLEVKAPIYEYNDDVAEGQIFRQVPSPDFPTQAGEEVTIFVSLGGRPFPIKNLVGRTLEEARAYFEEEGLTEGRIRYEDSDQPEGTVLSQFPAAGSSIQKGKPVDLVVSRSESAPQDSDEEQEE